MQPCPRRPVAHLQVQRGLNEFLLGLQQLGGERRQFASGQAAVAFVHRLRERIGDPGADSGSCRA